MNAVQNVFRDETAGDSFETESAEIVSLVFLYYKNPGAYGARTRNLRRDRAAL